MPNSALYLKTQNADAYINGKLLLQTATPGTLLLPSATIESKSAPLGHHHLYSVVGTLMACHRIINSKCIQSFNAAERNVANTSVNACVLALELQPEPVCSFQQMMRIYPTLWPCIPLPVRTKECKCHTCPWNDSSHILFPCTIAVLQPRAWFAPCLILMFRRPHIGSAALPAGAQPWWHLSPCSPFG